MKLVLDASVALKWLSADAAMKRMPTPPSTSCTATLSEGTC
jgi:hypothetical protein